MAKLHILEGEGRGGVFELKGDEISLGRSPENHIRLKDKSVSRNHAKITKRGDTYIIEDLQSKNGTYIKGMQITPGKRYRLAEGIPIALGNVVISLGKIPISDEQAAAKPIDPLQELSDDDMAALDSIDLSKSISAHTQAILDSMGLSKESGEQDADAFMQDRPLTPKRNMELIYKVSSVLMRSSNISENIHEILEKILRYILDFLKRTDRGFVILIDSETRKISDLIPILKKSAGDPTKMYSRTVVDRVIKKGKPVIILDTRKQDEAGLSESMKLMKIKSVMCVPLISKSKMRGVIYVDSINEPHGFRREDISLFTALSIPAAYAIENAMLSSAAGK